MYSGEFDDAYIQDVRAALEAMAAEIEKEGTE